jgi:hypothetical protein
MTDPILTQLITLRDTFALHLARLDVSDMDPLFKRVTMKQTREAVEELERQIGSLEPRTDPLHDDISEAKRYADCHEQ